MYSPRRNLEEHTNIKTSSPLRIVSSPMFNGMRTTQSKDAIDDLDRFYDNIQHKLTPSDSQTKVNTDFARSRLHDDLNGSCSPNRTSLTPFFERHTISEVSRPRYTRDIFEDSDVEDTPSLSDNNDDMQEDNFNKRLDRLSENLTKVRRMSSLLAESASSSSSDLLKDNDELPLSIHSQPAISLSTKSPISLAKVNPSSSNQYLATPPQSIKRTPVSAAKISLNASLATPPQSIDYTNVKRPIKLPKSPLSKDNTPQNNVAAKDLNAAKLKSTEVLCSPGGSRIVNRFWQEIHGAADKTKGTPLSERTSIIELKLPRTPATNNSAQRTPVSSLRTSATNYSAQRTPISSHRTPVSEHQSKPWTIDEDFWTSDDPVSNSLNHKLLQAAQQNEPVKKYNKRNIFYEEDDEESWYKHRLSKVQDEPLKSQHVHEDDDKESLYRNRLFRAQREARETTPKKSRDDDEESWYRSRFPKAQQATTEQEKSPQQVRTDNEESWYKSRMKARQHQTTTEQEKSPEQMRADDEESWYTSRMKARQQQVLVEQEESLEKARDDDEESWYHMRMRARQEESLNRQRDDDVESLYRNKLFRARRAAEQQQQDTPQNTNLRAIEGKTSLHTSKPRRQAKPEPVVEPPRQARDDDEQSWYKSRLQQQNEQVASIDLKRRNMFDDDEESLYKNRLFKAQKANHHHTEQEKRQRPQSLFAELETASTRESIIKRDNIPKVFPNVLAELKAKHGHRLIDDSDEYKFA